MLKEASEFFDRPNELILPEFAATWRRHDDDKKLQRLGTPKAKVIVANTISGRRLFRVQHAVGYSHEYTMKRWPDSIGPEINDLYPAEVVTYRYRAGILNFVKTQQSANIWLEVMQEVDRTGEPIDKKGLSGKAFCEQLDLVPKSISRLYFLSLPQIPDAFYLSHAKEDISEEALNRLEDELLRGFNP